MDIHIAHAKLYRWGDEIVVMAVKKSILQASDVEASPANKKKFTYASNAHTKQAFLNNEQLISSDEEPLDETQNSHNLSLTEQEIDRRNVEEFKQNDFKGGSSKKMRNLTVNLIIGYLIYIAIITAAFVLREDKVPYVKGSWKMFVTELKVEMQLTYMRHLVRRLEMIGSGVYDANATEIMNTRYTLLNTTKKITDFFEEESHYQNVFKKTDNHLIPLINFKYFQEDKGYVT